MIGDPTPGIMATPSPGNAPMDVMYPAVYNLRINQLSRGMDLSRLSSLQRGVSVLQHLHHISKTIGADASSFRVRVCKSCSGLPKLLELGSYADLESAVLVNDGYELLQGRTQKLHLLVPHDVDFLDMLKVRRHARGKIEEANLMDILQEKFIRTRTKRNIVEITAPGLSNVPPMTDGTDVFGMKRTRYDENTDEVEDIAPVAQRSTNNTALVQARTGALSQLNGSFVLNPPMKLQTMLRTMKQNGRSLTAMYLWFGIVPDVRSVEGNLNSISHLLRAQCVLPMAFSDDDPASRRDAQSLSKSISLPASNIYNLIACYTPGDTGDIQSLVSKLQPMLAVPSLSAQNEARCFKQTINSLSAAQQNPQSAELWKQLLTDVVQYARMTLHGYIWVDYAMKLPLWTEGFDGGQDMFGIETKFQGMMGACNSRVERSLRLLGELSTFSRAVVEQRLNAPVQFLGDLRRANLLLSRATIFGLLQLASIAFLVAKVCEDFSAVESCIRQYEKVWPQVDTTSCPLLLLMMLTHRYLELVTFGLARLDLSGWHNTLQPHIALAMRLQRDLITLGRVSGILEKRPNEIPYGPGFMQFHEKAIRAYTTLLALAAALGDASFFSTEGYSLRGAVDMTHDIMVALHEWITQSQCSLYDSHTYISLQTLALACQKLINIFPSYARPLQFTYQRCIEVLSISSRRFGLPKILLEGLGTQADIITPPVWAQTIAEISVIQASWPASKDSLVTFSRHGELNRELGNIDELSGFRNPAADPAGFHALHNRFDQDNSMDAPPTSQTTVVAPSSQTSSFPGFGQQISSGSNLSDSSSNGLGLDIQPKMNNNGAQFPSSAIHVAQDPFGNYGHMHSQMTGMPPEQMDPSMTTNAHQQFQPTPDPFMNDLLSDSPTSISNFGSFMASIGRTFDMREINLETSTSVFQREENPPCSNGMTPEQIALHGEPNATRVV